jgi:hypothetical protein
MFALVLPRVQICGEMFVQDTHVLLLQFARTVETANLGTILIVESVFDVPFPAIVAIEMLMT